VGTQIPFGISTGIGISFEVKDLLEIVALIAGRGSIAPALGKVAFPVLVDDSVIGKLVLQHGIYQWRRAVQIHQDHDRILAALGYAIVHGQPEGIRAHGIDGHADGRVVKGFGVEDCSRGQGGLLSFN
jgi:hypothetical protein